MRSIILFILILQLSSNGYSQLPEWINYTSGNEVIALASEGNDIWIGTTGGLVKLNKITSEVTFYNKANSGLPDNSVSAIALDSVGNKWIGTLEGGIAKFDGTNWIVYNTRNSGLPHNKINAIAIGSDGIKWIGCLSSGLVRFDGTNFSTYTYFDDNNVTAILPKKDGTIWVGTDFSIMTFNGYSLTLLYRWSQGFDVHAIAADDSGYTWFATFRGLYKWDGINWSSYNTPGTYNMFHALAVDHQQNKWLGTDGGGLVKFDGTEWTIYNSTNSGLPTNYVASILIDGSANKWIGTSSASGWGPGKGLVKFDGTDWTHYNTSNSGLPSNDVGAVAVDPQGNKWIACSGLLKFDGTKWEIFKPDSIGPPIAIDIKGNIWVGIPLTGYGGSFYGGGIGSFDGVNLHTYTSSNSNLPAGIYINQILVDRNDEVWVAFQIWGTSHGGLARFDGHNWKIYDSNNSPLPDDAISSIAIDSSDNIWVGGYCLAKFDRINWTIYTPTNSGMPNDEITALAIDWRGNIWIGTYWRGYGVVKFDGKSWTSYNTENSGIVGNNVRTIEVDADGNIWIGTVPSWSNSEAFGGGLSKYDGTNWIIYDKINSGLPGYFGSAYHSTIAIDKNGNKWIGTTGGLAVYKAVGIVSIKEKPCKNIPSVFTLSQNYPNPFNPTTVINYELPVNAFVTLRIYDILGREAKSLVNERQTAGSHSVTFAANNFPSGVYFCRIQAGSFSDTKKLILLR